LDLMLVRSWLAGLEREAVSPNTVAKAYRLLARIMDTAVEAGLIVRNPCAVKGAATERAAEMRVATVTQVAALAQAIHPRFRALVLVAAYAGLRWGELVGLRVRPGGSAASADHGGRAGDRDRRGASPGGRPRPRPAGAP
jgi:integrase